MRPIQKNNERARSPLEGYRRQTPILQMRTAVICGGMLMVIAPLNKMRTRSPGRN